MAEAKDAVSPGTSQSNHIRTRTDITLRTWKKCLGGRKATLLRIPLEEIGVQPDGLLVAALEGAPSELPDQQLRHLARELPHLLLDPAVCEVLNRRPHDLAQTDIRQLFEAIERVIEGRHERGGRHAALNGCTYVFRHFQHPLGDGNLARDSGFSTKFDTNVPRKEPIELDASAEEEVAALTFRNLAERKAKAHAIFNKKKSQILCQCTEHFSVYEATCEELNKIQAAGLEGLPQKLAEKLSAGEAVSLDLLRRMPDSHRLQVAVWMTTTHQAHVPKSLAITAGILVSGLPAIQPLALGPGHYASTEALLARRHLPKSVVYVCLSILVLETALNRDTLLSMKYSNVRHAGPCFRLHGVKPKTDQLHTRNLFSSADAGAREDEEEEVLEVVSDLAVKALRLLVKNCESYIEHANASDPPLFSVQRLRSRNYPQPTTLSEAQFSAVRQLHPEWRFNVVQLRNLAAQVHYTSPDGDIFSTQGLLQHASPHATATYLNDIVVKWLHQASINRYMKMLAASILWVVDRQDLLEKHELRLFIHRPLLFPLTPGKPSGATTAIDAWISSCGKSTLSIGSEEIHHIALQHRYYKARIRSLAEQSPLAFLRYDLPRIVTCLALRQVVSASRHAGLLLSFEESTQ